MGTRSSRGVPLRAFLQASPKPQSQKEEQLFSGVNAHWRGSIPQTILPSRGVLPKAPLHATPQPSPLGRRGSGPWVPFFRFPALTSLAGLRREKRRRGQRRCRCPEHQLRMLSHSTVRVGPGPSSRCSKTSCFKARTAVFSSICSSYGRQTGGGHRFLLYPHLTKLSSHTEHQHECAWLHTGTESQGIRS